MSIDTKHKVPALRFPGFRDEWATKVLRTITDIYDGTHQTPKYEKSGVPFYSVEHVTADQFSETKFISEEVFEQERKRVVIEKGDILMTRIGSIGVAKYIDWDVRASFYVSLALIKVSDEVIGKFVTQYIMTESFQRELWKRTIHVAFPIKINLGEIGNCIIHIPEKKEQQKIADFLTSVDTKIEQLAEKKALLEQYKKGMMQKLFSQELRFKDEDGNDFPDWKIKELGDLYEFKVTNSFSREQLNDSDGHVHNIHYGDIHTKFKVRFKLQDEDVPFINPDINIKNIPEDFYCQEGDLVMVDASEDYSDIGKTIEIMDLNGKQVLAGLHTLLARPDLKHITIGYGAYVMAVYDVKHQIMRIAQGTKVLSISAGRMRKIKIPIPSKEEQQKIADFLSAIDRKITLTDTQLTKAKAFKKGLLQRMFT